MKRENHLESIIENLVEQVLSENEVKKEDLLFAESISFPYLWDFIFGAGKVMRELLGDNVFMCSIANVKSGNCSEDCAFCAQSSRSRAQIPRYDLIEDIDILFEKAMKAKENGSREFCLVAAWRGVKRNSRNLDLLCRAIEKLKNECDMEVAVSLGQVDKYVAGELISAGAKRYNHNLETSEEFFPNICSTHTWREKRRTVEILKEAGFEVCSGGIIGMGESWRDRVNLAWTLRELDVDHIPVNILIPIPGTPFENFPPLHPVEALKTIAMFRYLNPRKIIIVAGGREKNLRDLQSYIFAAGANGIIGGDYLTTKGRSILEDVQMVNDLGYKFL